MIPHTNYQAASQGRIGVIDIGSNSIRLVIYDQLKRAPHALYNEKVLCQLGKGLAISGKLNPDGVEMARSAIARYIALARNMEVTELDVFATAAVRDASDGQAFKDSLEKEYNLHIDIISGEREAKLGAYGILAAIHQPEGITGDLGGGSMELVRLEKRQRIGERVTLPIGPLRLLDQTGGNHAEAERIVKKELQAADWLKSGKPERFYAIGGSFRAIAKMHMLRQKYPLRVLHGYTLERDELAAFAREIAEASPEALAKMNGVADKRIPTLGVAATVLQQVMDIIAPKQVIFSASGIREGYLYEKLSPFVREEDVLIASCCEFAGKTGRSIAYANELFSWINPLISKQSEAEERLTYAFCLLNDLARYIHPEHRAEWSYMRVMQSGLHGVTHEERVQLALALYHRHQFKAKDKLMAHALAGSRVRAWALLVGTLANLAYHLTGGIAGSLPEIGMNLSKTKTELGLPKPMQKLMGDAIKKRISGVEESYANWRKVA